MTVNQHTIDRFCMKIAAMIRRRSRTHGPRQVYIRDIGERTHDTLMSDISGEEHSAAERRQTAFFLYLYPGRGWSPVADSFRLIEKAGEHRREAMRWKGRWSWFCKEKREEIKRALLCLKNSGEYRPKLP